MGWVLHVRQAHDDEEPVFRIWSTVVDGYVTEELTEEDAKEFWLQGELKVAMGNFERFWERELPRAKEFGMSHYDDRYDTPTLKNPDWEDEREL